VVSYNCESLYRGTLFTNVRFEFSQGKIVDAQAGANTAKLNEILDVDAGARYLGEWSLGVNPYITNPMRDTLFDEKIAGSFHLTPGQCYKEASNGNNSQIHWDIVCRQDLAVGGGEIWFDDQLIPQRWSLCVARVARSQSRSLDALMYQCVSAPCTPAMNHAWQGFLTYN
jgi:aminopeptidase